MQALSDGYFGLNRVLLAIFLTTVVVLVIPSRHAVGPFTPAVAHQGMVVLLTRMAIAGVLSGAYAYRWNRKIGVGYGWSWLGPVLASIGIGLASMFCLGFFAFALMKNIAAQEIRQYGIDIGFWGGSRSEIELMVASIRAREQTFARVDEPLL